MSRGSISFQRPHFGAARGPMKAQTFPDAYSPAPRVLPDLPSTMTIISWNVNFMAYVVERLRCALEHMRSIVLLPSSSRSHPCCILLQEVTGPGFQTLLSTDWIQTHFSVIPQTEATDENGYGCVTLISNNIPLIGTWSLPFPSEMRRSAILTDLLFASGPGLPPVKVRVANVHLESLSSGARARTVQLSLTAERLLSVGVDFGIVGGDMNAISDSDKALPEACGLVDSWKGANNDESGFTWGYQPTSRFLPGRLDKICHTPSFNFALDVPRRIGVNLKTPTGRWVSDHYGLATDLRIYGFYDAAAREVNFESPTNVLCP